MDAWSHLLFTYSIGLLIGIIPVEKHIRFFSFIIVIELVNLGLGYLSSDFYNIIGVLLRGPVIAYFLFLRYSAKSELEKAQYEKMAVLLFFATYVAAASHNLDIVIERSGYEVLEHSTRRGHNLWHTPFFALLISIFVLGLSYPMMLELRSRYPEFEPRNKFNVLVIIAIFGYFTHILGDILVFDFQIYWLYPIDDSKYGILDWVDQGNLTKEGTADKPEGTTYYWASPFFAFLVSIFVVMKFVSSQNSLRDKFITKSVDS